MVEMKIGKFADVYAWFVTKDGRMVAQGYDEDKTVALTEAQSEKLFWSTHDYETD